MMCACVVILGKQLNETWIQKRRKKKNVGKIQTHFVIWQNVCMKIKKRIPRKEAKKNRNGNLSALDLENRRVLYSAMDEQEEKME